MFEQIYSNLKKRYQQSWFRFFLQYTALGKLLEHHTTVDAVTFYDTCLSSWWWNRLWFRTFIQDRDHLQRFDTVLDSLWLLEKAKISTQENRALIADYAHPESLASAFSHLQTTGILTQDNFLRVANHENPERLVYAFFLLQKAGILTQENLVLVTMHADPFRLTSAISVLQRAGMLMQENLVLVAKHADPDSLAFAFSDLQTAGILTPENRTLLANHASPTLLTRAFSYLQDAGILTPANRTLVAKHADPYRLTCALDDLQSARILTQANFAALIASHHAALIAAETEQLIWSRIPIHLLTQAHFEILVTAAEQANPMAALQRALHVILGADILAGAPAAFNQAQSTHTASVHRSVSASAVRLMNHYGADLHLAATIQQLKTDVSGLDDSFKHLAAKRCIERIASPHDTFTDSSGVTTHQLLALAYLAIHDESRRQGTLEDAQTLLVDGLYEIQRGYNLDAQGIDNQDPVDAPICLAGTFNKLMEKLNGIHLDVEVYFITHEGLHLKFPKVVAECVCNYLTRLASPETATGYVTTKKLLDRIKDNGLEPVWDNIKAAVEAKLWDEFKEAYAHKPEDSRFRAMIEYGHDSNAPDLTALYARLEASPGYQAFLYQLQQKNLAEQQFFFSSNRHGLWANRHHSADDQKAFDKEFTIVSFSKSP